MDIQKLIDLHNQGLTARKIALEMQCHHTNVNYHLKRNGLVPNGRRLEPINKIDEFIAKCSRCSEIKSIDEFQKGRKDQMYEYHFSYCNECRKKQLYLNLNNHFDRWLKDRLNRLKRVKRGVKIEFNLDFDYILFLFNSQNGKCFYTDEKLTWGVGKSYTSTVLSFDKIVPEKGYIKGNVVLCSNRINTIKNNLTLKELEKWMPSFHQRIMNFLSQQ